MATTPPAQSRWTDSFLDSMRLIGDPVADNVVGQLFAAGDVPAVNAMMQTLVANDGLAPESLPQVVRGYLDQSGELPSWADPALIGAGEEVFWKYGPQIITVLFCYSLPVCYAARKGVQVLWLTSRLYTNPTRRAVETAQAVMDVMQPGGLAAGGSGVRSAQKIRLMHAGVRYQIGKYAGWDANWGTPVNQEDLAGTLMSFAWAATDGLRRLGFSLTAAEREAYFHSWKVAGHILGIRPDCIPDNPDEAEILIRMIERRQYAACAEGQAMTRALIEMLQHTVPGGLLDPVPPALIRYFMGDAYADLLGVEQGVPEQLVVEPLRLINHLLNFELHSSEPIARIAEIFSRKLIEAIECVERGGKRIPFRIPTELRQAWGLNWTA